MILDIMTGLIMWPEAKASTEPYQPFILSRNNFGSIQVSVTLEVPPSYKAVLDNVPTGPFLQASQVLISGRVEFLVADSPLQGTAVPVNIM